MSKGSWDTSKNYTNGQPYQVNEVAHAKMWKICLPPLVTIKLSWIFWNKSEFGIGS